MPPIKIPERGDVCDRASLLPLTTVSPPHTAVAPPAELATLIGSLVTEVAASREVFTDLAGDVKRIADKLDPPPPDIVGTPYLARKLGCTTTWIADLIRRGEIPGNCVVPGTGHGKIWKFYRERIDRWIATR